MRSYLYNAGMARLVIDLYLANGPLICLLNETYRHFFDFLNTLRSAYHDFAEPSGKTATHAKCSTITQRSLVTYGRLHWTIECISWRHKYRINRSLFYSCGQGIWAASPSTILLTQTG